MAVERAAFEALAHEDPLTGLPNKRAFDTRFETELRRAAREYYPVALVVLDLDHFKQINDTRGHDAGDRVLAEAAQRMCAAVRSRRTQAQGGASQASRTSSAHQPVRKKLVAARRLTRKTSPPMVVGRKFPTNWPAK